MISSMRGKILAIVAATVVVSLALTSGAIYLLVRADNTRTTAGNLESLAAANAFAISEWSAAKSTAVAAAAADIAAGDPGGRATHLLKSGGFSLTTAGWQDKRFVSSTPGLPAGYDPTIRPWYQDSLKSRKPLITKPYRSATGVVLVSFTAPILREGSVQGVVAGGVSLATVRDVVKAIRPTPASMGFVVDAEGVVIAHPDENLLLKPATEIAPSLTAIGLAVMARDKEVAEVGIGGAAKWLRAVPIAGTDWLLVIALDRHDASAGMRSVLEASTIAVLLLAAISTLISGIVTARSFTRLSEARDAMDVIASGSGDLTRRLPVTGKDEVAQIASSFNRFVDKIEHVLFEIRDSSWTIHMASRDIASGNMDLSSRTEAQASSLEETAAAMEQITSSVQNNADNAIQANRLSHSASEIAGHGGAMVERVVETMEAINSSSQKIVGIIGVIDGIAFQTNILALNAAVEAARAGEQGRGFAVVASEVRSLAQRSAAAAKEIKVLISSSVEQVRAGEETVARTGAAIRSVVESVRKVSDVVAEITSASLEQSRGINQTNEAVGQMDQVTQQNAALVEEAAASAHALQEQAARLSQIVAQFRLSEVQPDADRMPMASLPFSFAADALAHQ
ncbi:methyl-accepting chemotaxis protein [Herbaspirillum rubrisubalbicans]|uniref:methyl-accepting chemotaxis protein n=1 Tax=Herbaspirillum rubrisubalbicans TaxID=80842 RepID=UPI000DD35FC4